MSNVQKTDLELRNKIPDIEHPASAEAAQLPAPEEDDGTRWSLVLVLPTMPVKESSPVKGSSLVEFLLEIRPQKEYQNLRNRRPGINTI